MPDKKDQKKYSFGNTGLLPQEEMLEIGKKTEKLIIGIPKENRKYESRVGLTPEAVELLVNNGHEIIIEKNAGLAANYTNNDYSECGGQIVDKKTDVFQCDIVLKIAPPTLEELELFKTNQVLFSSLHFLSQSEEYIRKLMQKKVTAISFEGLKDKDNCYPVVRSMSEIAGTTSILIAAEYLSNVHDGKGVLLGGVTGITSTEVLIIGAGTAAEYAARAALGLGAFIKVFDCSISKLKRLQANLSQPLFTSVFHPKVIEKHLKSADVVIGAVHFGERGPQHLISEEMVKKMKKGAVIVDLSIDQGGCIETSECMIHANPVYTKHGVIHYCVPNIASRVARTASIALSNVFNPLLLSIAEAGGIKKKMKEELGLRHGVYVYNGILTSSRIGNTFGIPSKDIDLLMAAF
ncbi:MAG: alanine dehydrogenase [Bacteroidales bacterium]|jgi:alanine dehydrogenase|nr:alanine dehydrogenase [Bacteroidales bacterium]